MTQDLNEQVTRRILAVVTPSKSRLPSEEGPGIVAEYAREKCSPEVEFQANTK